MARADGRKADELRPLEIIPNYIKHAEGSAFVRQGETWVLCTASVEERLPPFLVGQTQQGWVTAEYGMLPRSTHTRTGRQPGGRGQEIQRLVGRALRMAVNLRSLGPRTINVDCDVIQADGGTRTASITGGWVALALACRDLLQRDIIKNDPIIAQVQAVSVGIVGGHPQLDLAYSEDSGADVDMNIVMAGADKLIEVQGTAEKAESAYDLATLTALIKLAQKGCGEIMAKQQAAVATRA
jgi:ribonuclease PH